MPCRNEIPHLNALQAQKAEAGLVVVGVTGEPAKEVEAYVLRNAVKHPIAVAAVTDYAVRAIPAAFLIDKDGKVVWRGHPASLENTVIDKLLVGARPAIVAPGLEEVHAKRRAKDFGAAYARAKALLDGGTLGEKATAQAKNWLQEYETFVQQGLTAAAEAATGNDVYRQWLALQPVADWYQGVPGADQAKAKFDALIADPKNKKEIEAGRKFAVGKAREDEFQYDAAYAIWKEVSTLFGTTKVGKEALVLMKAYEKDGKLGYDHSCGYCKAGGAACAQHAKKKKK